LPGGGPASISSGVLEVPHTDEALLGELRLESLTPAEKIAERKVVEMDQANLITVLGVPNSYDVCALARYVFDDHARQPVPVAQVVGI